MSETTPCHKIIYFNVTPTVRLCKFFRFAYKARICLCFSASPWWRPVMSFRCQLVTCGVFKFKTHSVTARFSPQMTGGEFLETLHRGSGGSHRDREKKIAETMVLLVTPHGMSTFYFAEQRTLKPVINHILQRLATNPGVQTLHPDRLRPGRESFCFLFSRHCERSFFSKASF